MPTHCCAANAVGAITARHAASRSIKERMVRESGADGRARGCDANPASSAKGFSSLRWLFNVGTRLPAHALTVHVADEARGDDQRLRLSMTKRQVIDKGRRGAPF
jgi:hypothetical protein